MLKIHLEAKDSSLNLARLYYIDLTQDLFGDWILKITHGRIGSRGRDQLYAFKTIEEALPKIKTILSKRATAPRRSRCHYQLMEIYKDSSFPSFDVPEILQKSSSLTLEMASKPKKATFLPLFDKNINS